MNEVAWNSQRHGEFKDGLTDAHLVELVLGLTVMQPTTCAAGGWPRWCS
jgi:hypothetical protein